MLYTYFGAFQYAAAHIETFASHNPNGNEKNVKNVEFFNSCASYLRKTLLLSFKIAHI